MCLASDESDWLIHLPQLPTERPNIYESAALVKGPPRWRPRVIGRDRAGLTGNIYPA